MTKQQAEWAKLHDWFVWATVDASGVYTVTVREESHHVDTGWTTSYPKFTDYRALRDWAGY